MPFWRSYGHLVWATKNREPFITDILAQRLYGQIIQKAAGLGCYVYAINGMTEHLHVVLTVPPKRAVAEIAKMLKGSSAHFVNQVIRPPEYHFAWQRGYGFFSLGESQLERAIAYVERQKEHHARNTTNSWLERCSEHGEGPIIGKPDDGKINVIREASAGYVTLDDLPF